MSKIFFVSFIAIALTGSVQSPQIGAKANVYAYVINCPLDEAQRPNVAIDRNASYIQLKRSAEAVSPGTFLVTFFAPPGHERVRVSTTHCRRTLPLSVLPDRQRHITVALDADISTYFHRSSLAGQMPVPVDSIALISSFGVQRILNVDDSAYYIERVAPGKYLLRLFLTGGLQSDIPIDTTHAPDGSLIRHDITMQEIRQHLGSALASGGTQQDCYWCNPKHRL